MVVNWVIRPNFAMSVSVDSLIRVLREGGGAMTEAVGFGGFFLSNVQRF